MAAISSKIFRIGLLSNTLHTFGNRRATAETKTQENNMVSITDFSWTNGPSNGLYSAFRWQETEKGKLSGHWEIEGE